MRIHRPAYVYFGIKQMNFSFPQIPSRKFKSAQLDFSNSFFCHKLAEGRLRSLHSTLHKFMIERGIQNRTVAMLITHPSPWTTERSEPAERRGSFFSMGKGRYKNIYTSKIINILLIQIHIYEKTALRKGRWKKDTYLSEHPATAEEEPETTTKIVLCIQPQLRKS